MPSAVVVAAFVIVVVVVVIVNAVAVVIVVFVFVIVVVADGVVFFVGFNRRLLAEVESDVFEGRGVQGHLAGLWLCCGQARLDGTSSGWCCGSSQFGSGKP